VIVNDVEEFLTGYVVKHVGEVNECCCAGW
jgi:hypothetical protein